MGSQQLDPTTGMPIAPVTLTGSIIDNLNIKKLVSSIIPRSIRSSNPSTLSSTVPQGAKGCLIGLKVWGVTGTTPSLTFSVYTGFGPARAPFLVSHAGITTSKTNLGLMWYPGAVIGDGAKADALNKVVGIPIGNYLEFDFIITGTFASGEGFDTEADIIWMF